LGPSRSKKETWRVCSHRTLSSPPSGTSLNFAVVAQTASSCRLPRKYSGARKSQRKSGCALGLAGAGNLKPGSQRQVAFSPGGPPFGFVLYLAKRHLCRIAIHMRHRLSSAWGTDSWRLLNAIARCGGGKVRSTSYARNCGPLCPCSWRGSCAWRGYFAVAFVKARCCRMPPQRWRLKVALIEFVISRRESLVKPAADRMERRRTCGPLPALGTVIPSFIEQNAKRN